MNSLANVLWIHPPERGGFQKPFLFLFLWIPLQPTTAFQRALSPKPSLSRQFTAVETHLLPLYTCIHLQLLPELDLLLQLLDLLNPHCHSCAHVCSAAMLPSLQFSKLYSCS